MGHHLVAFVHLLLADAGAAAAAPGHGVVGLVNQAAFVAFLEKGPDRVVVSLGHREIRFALVGRPRPILVGTVPIHPVAQADRLIGLNAGVLVDAIFAALYEI